MSDGKHSRKGETSAPRSARPFLWMALPTLILLLLVAISLSWRVATRVQLDAVTQRLTFTLGGGERREILNRTVPFSSLVIEACGTVAVPTEKLEIADPQQVVPGAPEEPPTFPAAAWRELPAPDPVRFVCRDPGAKLTLRAPDPAAARLGLLDHIHFEPGSQVVLSASREPALTVETPTPQSLHLVVVDPDLEIVSDLGEPQDVQVPFPSSLLTWRARLPEARRAVEVTSGSQGLVLIVTPAPGQATGLFFEPLNLPVTSVEMLEVTPEGVLDSPLADKASLSYPDYPDAPVVTLEKEAKVDLAGLSRARLVRLELDPDKGALRVRFDGIVERAKSKSGDFASDHRLTVADTFVYDRRWKRIAVAAAWLVATAWAAFEARKQLRE